MPQNGIAQEGESLLLKVLEADERGAALAALAQDNEAMHRIALWFKEDEVGYFGAMARLQTGKTTRVGIRQCDAFNRIVDEIAQGFSRRSMAAPAKLSTFVKHPQADDLMVPPGYTLDALGTYSLRPGRGGAPIKDRVAHYPMILEGYVRDVETGASMVVVAWFANEQWRRMVVTREAMAIGSDISRAAAPYGAPIHTANSNAVILYLAAFEAQNLAHFEEVKGVSRMGWLPGQEAFLVGTQLVSETGTRPIQSPMSLHDGWAATDFVFVPSGREVERILSGYRQEGTLEGWNRAATLASNYPLAMAGLYVSMLPPLLQILGADNFVWEWSGKSSVGKTTALGLAASVWGQPRLNLEPSIVSSWRVTDVYIERMLATLGDLPMYLDDTRTASTRMKNGIDPVQVVYDVVSGTTKGRGTISGTEAKRAWRTILMSTGEEPITGDSTKLGVFARTWAIFGQPWGTTSPETAAMVLEIESLVSENYGVLGPLWVQRILEKRASWGKWRGIYRDIRDQYGTRGVTGENGGLAGRLGKNIAAIEVCANLALALLPEVFSGINFKPMLEDLWRWAQSDGAGADPIMECMLGVRNFCFANAAKFYPRGKEEPGAGWMGIWPMPSKGDLAPGIYIRPDILMAQVKALGHANFRVVMDEWHRRGWVRVAEGRRTRNGSATVFARKPVKLDDVKLFAIELRPPIEGEQTLAAYDDLSQRVAESVQ
jgi:hypothetical protein